MSSPGFECADLSQKNLPSKCFWMTWSENLLANKDKAARINCLSVSDREQLELSMTKTKNPTLPKCKMLCS